MNVRGYLPTSLIEWPGKIAAVVFVAGCNFRCPFCYNADLADPEKARRLPLIKEELIFADLKRRKRWVDGVVVSGGEPTLQPDLSGFLSRCKRMGLATMIETNGSRPEIIAKLLNDQMIDFIAMDIKTTFDRQYLDLIKAQSAKRKAQNYNLNLKTLENIKRSIRFIVSSGVDFEFRTTVVPTIHDKKKMVELARQLKGQVQRCRGTKGQSVKWVLQGFQTKNCLNPEFEKIKPYSQNEMEEILAAVRKYVPGAELRGE